MAATDGFHDRDPGERFRQTVKRMLDIVGAVVGISLALPVIVVAAVLIKIDTPGPVIFWSRRIGRNNDIFWMPKLRTMRVDTPQVATHLLADSVSAVTRTGAFLRRTSIDELPQFWNVLVGHMSLVGPRPALFNQTDLVAMRSHLGIDKLRPGLTGWAQINGRDAISLEQKVALDAEYLARQTLTNDIKILALTARKVLLRENVKH